MGSWLAVRLGERERESPSLSVGTAIPLSVAGTVESMEGEASGVSSARSYFFRSLDLAGVFSRLEELAFGLGTGLESGLRRAVHTPDGLSVRLVVLALGLGTGLARGLSLGERRGDADGDRFGEGSGKSSSSFSSLIGVDWEGDNSRLTTPSVFRGGKRQCTPGDVGAADADAARRWAITRSPSLSVAARGWAICTWSRSCDLRRLSTSSTFSAKVPWNGTGETSASSAPAPASGTVLVVGTEDERGGEWATTGRRSAVPLSRLALRRLRAARVNFSFQSAPFCRDSSVARMHSGQHFRRGRVTRSGRRGAVSDGRRTMMGSRGGVEG